MKDLNPKKEAYAGRLWHPVTAPERKTLELYLPGTAGLLPEGEVNPANAMSHLILRYGRQTESVYERIRYIYASCRYIFILKTHIPLLSQLALLGYRVPVIDEVKQVSAALNQAVQEDTETQWIWLDLVVEQALEALESE